MSKSLRACRAQSVVEEQSEAIHHLLLLRNHTTVRMNASLRELVDGAWKSLVTANAYACVLYFPRDTHQDVAEYLPPLDAA